MTSIADEASEPTTVDLADDTSTLTTTTTTLSSDGGRRSRAKIRGLHNKSLIVERNEFEREVTLHESAHHSNDYSLDILEQPKHTYLEHDIDEDSWHPSDDLLTLYNQLSCERKVMTKLRTWLKKTDIFENTRLDRRRCDIYCIDGLESPLNKGYASQDASRPWITYWILNALSILGDESLIPVLRTKLHNGIIDFLSNKCQINRGCSLSCTHASDESYRFDTSKTMKQQPLVGASEEEKEEAGGGFGGGPLQLAHLATSFGAIMSLLTLGTEEAMSSIDRLSFYQFACNNRSDKDGSYTIHIDGETDIRAVYCAFASLYLLHLNGSIDDEQLEESSESSSAKVSLLRPLSDPLTYEWLRSCQRYDGGFSQEPMDEAHGGYAYCGFASLLIMQQSMLDDYRQCKSENKSAAIEQLRQIKSGFMNRSLLDRIHRWASMRQMSFSGGFQGRTDKLVDGCYSFWVGALFPLVQLGLAQYREYHQIVTLMTEEDGSEDMMLPSPSLDHLISMEPFQLQKYLLVVAQTPPGGFCDKPYKPADYYHNCYALNGLSVCQHYSAVPQQRVNAALRDDDEDSSMTTAVVLGPKSNNLVRKVHPLFGITMDKFENAIRYFQSQPSIFEMVAKRQESKGVGGDSGVSERAGSMEVKEDPAGCATV